ncbi:DMT family transporter [Paucibacter sp. XJ19-41]|uniref:DMT family transporter n=1 Tax=Paucibacter sp. XJ19-41 TaxID=2927824 RepID=UPI00234A1822|nr:EamA family transporter [Paucibacter sp. XJ19-41]MDC6170743.1 EamA family transporter [Paucibacter sp. XJ19-41]
MPASTLAPAPTASREERQGQALMLAGGLLLGTLGVFLEEAGQDPLTAVWFRCAFGALALLVWGLASARLGELRLARRGLLAAVAAGLLMLVNWVLFFAAIERSSIAVATVVFHVQPLLVMAFGVLFLREPFSRRQGAAVLIALLGLALATGLLDQWREIDSAYGWGLLMCLGGSFSYAAVTLIAKSVRGVSSFALSWWQCAVGSVVLLAWPLTQGWPAWGAAWGWLAGLGLIHTGLAYVLLYAGINRLPAGRIALLQFVYPAAAVLVDWAVYGRALSPLQLLGVAMMAGAIASLKR